MRGGAPVIAIVNSVLPPDVVLNFLYIAVIEVVLGIAFPSVVFAGVGKRHVEQVWCRRLDNLDKGSVIFFLFFASEAY